MRLKARHLASACFLAFALALWPSISQAAVTPDFTISATPASQCTVVLSPVSYQVTVTRSGGFTDPVYLRVAFDTDWATGAPFTPNPVYGSGSVMTITPEATRSAGPHTLTIAGIAGVLYHSITVTLVISSVCAVNGNGDSSGDFNG
jgi:hypothetical protein